MIVLLVYAGSLVSYYLLSGSQRALPPPDLGYSGDTIVQVTLQSMHPVDNRVDVKVRVIPADTLMTNASKYSTPIFRCASIRRTR